MNRRDLLKTAAAFAPACCTTASAAAFMARPTSMTKAWPQPSGKMIPYLPKFWATHAAPIIDRKLGGRIQRSVIEVNGEGCTLNFGDGHKELVTTIYQADGFYESVDPYEFLEGRLIGMAERLGDDLVSRLGPKGILTTYELPIGKVEEPIWQGARVWLNDFLLHCHFFQNVESIYDKEFCVVLEVSAAIRKHG